MNHSERKRWYLAAYGANRATWVNQKHGCFASAPSSAAAQMPEPDAAAAAVEWQLRLRALHRSRSGHPGFGGNSVGYRPVRTRRRSRVDGDPPGVVDNGSGSGRVQRSAASPTAPPARLPRRHPRRPGVPRLRLPRTTATAEITTCTSPRTSQTRKRPPPAPAIPGMSRPTVQATRPSGCGIPHLVKRSQSRSARHPARRRPERAGERS